MIKKEYKILAKNLKFPEGPIFMNDGSIILNIVGGVEPLTVTWDDDPTSGDERYNLGPGVYNVLIEDSSGNKSSEALKVAFSSVDKYGHESSVSVDVAGYKLSVISGSTVVSGSPEKTLQPNQSLDGTDYYLINSANLGAIHSPTLSDGLIEFEITLPDGKKLTHTDFGINLKYDSKEVFNYKNQGWFTIDNQSPAAGNIKFESDFSDIGRNLTDKKTNDTAFTIGINGQEAFSKVDFFVDIDGGGYNKTTELQTISSDGTYKYKAEITDLAGNTSTTPVETVIIETVAPVMSAITLINKPSYIPLINTLGVNSVISPAQITVSSILSKIRSGSIKSIHSIIEERGEVFEARALESSNIVGKPLRTLKLPKSICIGAIYKDDEIIIPNGDTIIDINDIIIVFAEKKSVKKLETILSIRMDLI